VYEESRTAGDAATRFRLYRNGTIGSAIDSSPQDTNVRPIIIARRTNAQLAYMGWVWERLGLRTPVELRLELRHLEGGRLWRRGDYGEGDHRTPSKPTDFQPPVNATLIEEFLASDLRRAHVRHSLVRGFLDRVHQGYGVPRASADMFTAGWLYGSDGRPLGISVIGDGLCRGTDSLGRIYADGYVERARDATQIGRIVDGVLLDREGNAMAAVEMAVGSGLPDDFVVRAFTDDALYACLGPDLLAAPQTRIAPTPTGRWSSQRLTDFIV
jgi:hypothetical protein